MLYYLINTSEPIQFLSAGKSLIKEDWIHYERVMNEYILFMVLSGALYLNVDGVEYPIAPNECFLMKPHAHHVGYKASPVTFYWMHFSANQIRIITEAQARQLWTQGLGEHQFLLPMTQKLEHIEVPVTHMSHLIHFSQQNSIRDICNYLSTTILLELVNQAQEKMDVDQSSKTKGQHRFEAVQRYIMANHRENLTISEVAQKFEYSQKHLSKLFRTKLHMTMTQFLNETRLRVAEGLLLSTDEPVAVISASVGFDNPYYFMRLFKKKNGISPTHYRNNYFRQNLTKYKS